MSDLTEFLLARIAEDEAVARQATDGPWQVGRNGEVEVTDGADVYGFPHYVTCDTEGLTASVDLSDADHIARWDPARVLVECEAKRRIVRALAARGPDSGMTSEPDKGATWAIRRVCELLALPYADHPDFREERRP